MQVQAGDVILVHFLVEQPVGLRFLRHRNDWPLHITLLPWFSASDEAKFITELLRLATQSPSFTVSMGEQTMFNPQTKVSLVNDGGKLRQLHLAVLKATAELSVQHRTLQWTGDAYKPHVTHHDAQFVPESGTELLVQNFSLVRLEQGNMCEVLQHFKLAGK